MRSKTTSHAVDGQVEVVGVGVTLGRRPLALGPDDGAEIGVAGEETVVVHDVGRRGRPEGIGAVCHHVEVGLRVVIGES